MPVKRHPEHIPQDRPSWDEYFMEIAHVVKKRSIDAETKVGCVIVDRHNRIVSTGYNGFPPGVDDRMLPNTRPGKYFSILHAEQNTIANAKTDLRGCTIYVTISPCQECAKLILAAGIKKIVFDDKYANSNSDETIEFLRKAGAEVVEI